MGNAILTFSWVDRICLEDNSAPKCVLKVQKYSFKFFPGVTVQLQNVINLNDNFIQAITQSMDII